MIIWVLLWLSFGLQLFLFLCKVWNNWAKGSEQWTYDQQTSKTVDYVFFKEKLLLNPKEMLKFSVLKRYSEILIWIILPLPDTYAVLYCTLYNNPNYFIYVLYPAKNQYWKFETNIPRKGIVRPQSQIPHSCVCERFIYSHDRSAYSGAGNMWIDPGNIKIDLRLNVEIGTEAGQFPEKEYMNISLQCSFNSLIGCTNYTWNLYIHVYSTLYSRTLTRKQKCRYTGRKGWEL